MAVYSLQERIYANACNHGFWEPEQKNFLAKVALAHSELSEVVEAYRKKEGNKDQHCPKFSNLEIELADTVIRVLDLATGYGFTNLGEAILAKMDFNEGREYLHGKKH